MDLFRALNYCLEEVNEPHGLITIIAKVELQTKIETLRQILYLIKSLRDMKENLDKLDQVITSMLNDYQNELDNFILSEPVYSNYYDALIEEAMGSRKQTRVSRIIKTPHK